MNAVRAKNFIGYLSNRWKINSPLDSSRIIDSLKNSNSGTGGRSDEYEFSLVSLQREIRPLNLNFYQFKKRKQIVRALGERIGSIINILESENRNQECGYNTQIMKEASSVAKDFLLPIQFGWMLNASGKVVFKEYFSVMNNEFSCPVLLSKLCKLLSLNKEKIMCSFEGCKFDSIGIDFLPNSSCRLKVYTYYQKPFDIMNIKKDYKLYCKENQGRLNLFMGIIKEIKLRHIGFLYRISENSTIDSVKIWARLEKGAVLNLLPSIRKFKSAELRKWFLSAEKIIDTVKAKVSYIAFEGKKTGIYFR